MKKQHKKKQKKEKIKGNDAYKEKIEEKTLPKINEKNNKEINIDDDNNIIDTSKIKMQEFENKNRLNDYKDILNENPHSPLKDEEKM